MKTYIALIILYFTTTILTGQSNENPVEFLAGNWVRKVQSVMPKKAEEPWKGQTAYVEFKKTLNGKGLHQISYEEFNESEVHLFYDAPSKKMYGMTIDANGYVWQCEVVLEGNILKITGNAINDSSAREQVELIKIDASEISFTYTMFKNDQKILTAEGIFLKVPNR